MNSQLLAEKLDALSHAEQRSLLPRLMESTVFVSWVSADDFEAVGSMVQEERQHVAWLIDLINELGESPTPCTAEMHSSSLHYLELDYLMPMVLAGKMKLIQAYEQHPPALAENARAAELVARITDRHRAHLQTLRNLDNEMQPQPTA